MSRKCFFYGTKVQSGHNVSKSNRKTKRTFLPNTSFHTFHSTLLGKSLRLKVTSRTIKTIIGKYGDIDTFLLNVKGSKLTDEAKIMRSRVKKVANKNS